MGSKNKKKIILVTAVAILLIAAVVIIFFYNRSRLVATTMRVLRIEGEVKLEENGKAKTVSDNIRLNSDNALSTAANSLVSIGLDETKIVTLDQLSRAVFNKVGRKLHLDLTDGSMYVEVTKPLEADEKLDVETSTMIVGIRGTSVWISAEGDHDSIIVTDGHIHLIGRNPVTGEIKEIDVYGGQRLRTYTYNDREVDSIMFELEPITEHDLPELVLNYLREHPDLLDKVIDDTNWDKQWIQGKGKDEDKNKAPAVPAEPATEDMTADSNTENEDPSEEASDPDPQTDTAAPQDPAPDEAQIMELLELLAKAETEEPVIITPQEEWDSGNDDDDDDDDDEDEDDDDDDDDTSLQTISVSLTSSIKGTSRAGFDGTGLDDMPPTPCYADLGNGAMGAVMDLTQSIKITAGNPNIRLPLDLNDTTGSHGFTITDPSKILPGGSDTTINVIWTVGGTTDVIRHTEVSSGNTTEYYSYGDSTDRYSTYVDTYPGSDGKIYAQLSGSTTGAPDLYISKTLGSIRNTPP